MRIPINACVVGMSGKPEGYVTDQVLTMMMKSYQDIQKFLKSKQKYEQKKSQVDEYLKKIHDALRQSVKGYNMKYVNYLHHYSDRFGFLDQKKYQIYEYIYFQNFEKIKEFSMSVKIKDSVNEYTINYMKRNGYKYVGKQRTIYESFCFQKDGVMVCLPVHEVCYLYRKGKHKMVCFGKSELIIGQNEYQNLQINSGLNNFVKSCDKYVKDCNEQIKKRKI